MNSGEMMKRKDGTPSYTTPRHYAPEVKVAVYEDYMRTDQDLSEIALAHGVSKEVISAWAKDGAWLDKKKEFERELMRIADEKYRVFVSENRLPVLRRQVRISGKLEDAIEQVVEEELSNPSGKEGGLNDMKLKRMAEALAAVSGVSTKAVGLADMVVQNNGNPGGRVPLVAINTVPQVPSDRTGGAVRPTIEVIEVEQ